MIQDDWLTDILNNLQDGKQVNNWELQEGLLMFNNNIFVPQDSTIRHLILESHHDNVAAGHPGQARTLDLNSRTYTLPSMKNL